MSRRTRQARHAGRENEEPFGEQGKEEQQDGIQFVQLLKDDPAVLRSYRFMSHEMIAEVLNPIPQEVWFRMPSELRRALAGPGTPHVAFHFFIFSFIIYVFRFFLRSLVNR